MVAQIKTEKETNISLRELTIVVHLLVGVHVGGGVVETSYLVT